MAKIRIKEIKEPVIKRILWNFMIPFIIVKIIYEFLTEKKEELEPSECMNPNRYAK